MYRGRWGKTAMQYNAAGFHAAVLSYSVEPHHFPEPQRDLMSAIRILRENGDKWGIHEEQIAIISACLWNGCGNYLDCCRRLEIF